MEKVTFAGLMERMIAVPEIVGAEIKVGLTQSAVEVHKTAIEKMGKYQPQIGPFEGWAALAASTVREKLQAGSAGDDPLIGHYPPGQKKSIYPTSLRQSITMEVAEMEAQVGTNDPVGEWQEFGTPTIPPRPFLRPALYQNEEKIKEIMKTTLGMALMRTLR